MGLKTGSSTYLLGFICLLQSFEGMLCHPCSQYMGTLWWYELDMYPSGGRWKAFFVPLRAKGGFSAPHPPTPAFLTIVASIREHTAKVGEDRSGKQNEGQKWWFIATFSKQAFNTMGGKHRWSPSPLACKEAERNGLTPRLRMEHLGGEFASYPPHLL